MSTSPYNEASKLLAEVLKHHKGLKSLVFDNKTKTMKCSKSTYATICQSLQVKSIIDDILQLNDSELHNKIMPSCRNVGLAYIMLYELLFGKYQSIRGGGALKRTIMKEVEALRAAKAIVCKAQTQTGEENDAGSSTMRQRPPQFPRYVRVNILKIDSKTAAQVLSDEILSKTGDDEKSLTSTVLYTDAHVPDLLVMSPETSSKLFSHPLVTEGKVVFQDKSSCFPALSLIQGNGSADTFWQNCYASNKDGCVDVVDACAAPGNKTTHLAALLQDQLNSTSVPNATSKVFALDRDSKRIKILQERVELLVPKPAETSTKEKKGKTKKNQNNAANTRRVQVVPAHMDFLQTKPSDSRFANVKAILLDPSCSGSGIVSQPDRYILTEKGGEDSNEASRIESLANFQLVALKHAMSFPQVDRIVYSTCFIHVKENEYVVSIAIQEYNDGVENPGDKWNIVRPACLDTWKRRGEYIANAGISKEEAKCMIRCDGLDGDETNGFFVCYLERRRGQSTKAKTKGDTAVHASGHSYELPIYNGQFRTEESLSSSISTPARPIKVDKGKGTNHKESSTEQAKNRKRARDQVSQEMLPQNEQEVVTQKMDKDTQAAALPAEEKSENDMHQRNKAKNYSGS